MKAVDRNIVFAITILQIACICRAEEAFGFKNSPAWVVGESWTVLTNVHAQLTEPEMSRRKKEKAAQLENKLLKLQKYWETNIKPKGVSQIDWEKTDDYQRQAEKAGLIIDAEKRSLSPYEGWMKANKDWMMVNGKELWCRWKFQVEAADKINDTDCLRIKVAFDSFKGFSEDEIAAISWIRKPKSYFRIWLRARDGTLAKFEERKTADDDILRKKQFDVAAPRYIDAGVSESFDPFFIAMPFAFPQFGLARFNSSSVDDRTTEAQRCVETGGWTIFTLADEAQIDNLPHGDKWPTGAERQFWRKGLPWWKEAYRFQYEGIRAQLESVNGKEIAKDKSQH